MIKDCAVSKIPRRPRPRFCEHKRKECQREHHHLDLDSQRRHDAIHSSCHRHLCRSVSLFSVGRLHACSLGPQVPRSETNANDEQSHQRTQHIPSSESQHRWRQLFSHPTTKSVITKKRKLALRCCQRSVDISAIGRKYSISADDVYQ